VLPPIAADEAHSMGRDDLRMDVQHRLKTAALDGAMVPPRHYIPMRDGYWDGYAFEIDPAFPELAADVDVHRRTLMGSVRPKPGDDPAPMRFDGAHR
jgi:1-acyl-sn-glycerol-3-phosphate acyltransferase